MLLAAVAEGFHHFPMSTMVTSPKNDKPEFMEEVTAQGDAPRIWSTVRHDVPNSVGARRPQELYSKAKQQLLNGIYFGLHSSRFCDCVSITSVRQNRYRP